MPALDEEQLARAKSFLKPGHVSADPVLFEKTDLLDVPKLFRTPITIVVDLPFPVSTNALWGYNRSAKKPVHPSPAYERWKKEANALALTQKVGRMKCIEGPFQAELLLQAGRRGDVDNAIKCVLDRAKAWELIADDRYCRKVTIEFVAIHKARYGAQLTLVEMP